MCGREKDKDKSSSIIGHLQTAVVEKDNVWERKIREKDKDKSSSIICHLQVCSGRERQCVGDTKIKTRVAQLFVTYRLQW